MTTPRDSEWLAWAGSVRREPRPMAVPESEHAVPDWLLWLAIFPGMLGLFTGLLCVLRLLGWEGL